MTIGGIKEGKGKPNHIRNPSCLSANQGFNPSEEKITTKKNWLSTIMEW